MHSNRKFLTFDPATAHDLSTEFTTDPNNRSAFDGSLQWEGWLRKLNRMGAPYDQ